MFGCSDLLGYLLDIPQTGFLEEPAAKSSMETYITSVDASLTNVQVDPGPVVFLCGLATKIVMMMMIMMTMMMTMTMSDDDDVAVLFKHIKHAFNELYVHVIVFINMSFSNTARDSQQQVLKLKGGNA